MSTPSKFYIAGPMTGIPQANIPAFDAAAEVLRGIGYEIVSPAELDNENVREASMEDPTGRIHDDRWGEFLARDVKIVSDEVDGIVTLPGWEGSRGARLEVYVCLACEKPVYAYDQYNYFGMEGLPFEYCAEAVKPKRVLP